MTSQRANVGGPSMRNLSGHVSASLDKAGFAKRRISFETSGFPAATQWHSRDKDFNPITHAIDRPIAPGEAVDLRLRITFPRPLPAEEVLLEGSILIVDTETGKTLSELPVHVYRSGTGTQGNCCE